MVPIILLTILFIFVFIGNLVDEYIEPSITYIKEYMNLSDAMGGVTLLALANGAGDVITAIVAAGSTEGVAYNIGSLFGAGLFVCAAVIAKTIMVADEDICCGPNTIYRDVGFYILGCLLVLFWIIYEVIPWWGAATMLALYALLVVVVFCQDKGWCFSGEEKGGDDDEKNKDKPKSVELTEKLLPKDQGTQKSKKRNSFSKNKL